jgi:hypothetical protein
MVGLFLFFTGPAQNTVIGRRATITGGMAAFQGSITSVQMQFGVGGPVVSITNPHGSTTHGYSWGFDGLIPNDIRPGQAFQVIVSATGFVVTGHDAEGEPTTSPADGQVIGNWVLENVVPVLTIDPFRSPVGVVQTPYVTTLTGSVSEANPTIYGVPKVQYKIGNGLLTDAQIPSPGRWQAPVSLQPGDTITIQASDQFKSVTTLQPTVNVLQYPMPAVIDPNAKKTEFLHLPTTSSVTSWTRLEPQVANADMGVSSNARLFDPLWLMTRQWQMGEFQGEDTGSPVQARVRATNAALTRCYFGELPWDNKAPPYDPTLVPLEVMVERRRMRPADDSDARMLTLAVDAGLHFLRMLDLNATAKKYRTAFLTNYTLQPLSTQQAPVADDATLRFVQTMVGRAPDARRLALAFRQPNTPQIVFDPSLNIAAADLAPVQQVATAWLAWYDGLFAEPVAPSQDAWVPSRLEYAVSVAVRLSAQPQDALTFSASEFDGGRLDWSSFDVNEKSHVDTTGDQAPVALNETTVPSPVTFAGAPAARFWEMEDAKVAYGLVPVGPTDLAHLMMIEYASSYGNDWYVVPLTVPVGTVTRVDSLVVTDTFGVRSLLRPIGDPALPKPYFSMWQQASMRYAGDQLGAPVSNRFFLPPTLARSVDGAVLEDVLFMRDEMSNLAWGIERHIEAPTETPLNLTSGSSATASVPSPPPATVPVAGAPRYLLSSTVPENWIPLLPVQIQPDPNGPLLSRLKRGAVLQPDGTGKVHLAQSEALKALGTALLFDEEVPREGVHITRRRRMVRWIDGSSWVWTAFRNEIGGGEGSAGLRFDQLQPPDSAAPVVPAPPPTLTAPTLAQTLLAIEGASGTYTATIANPGPGLSSVTFQGWISQGTVRRAAGATLIDCGSGAGVLPNGTFTVPGSIAASNGGSGIGTLVPGAATFELQLQQSTTVLATTTVPLTLMSNAPPSITALSPIAGSVFIGGSSTPYSATLGNPGVSRSNVVLQGWINQGTARRAAGGSMVMCGAGVGVLPNGTFPVSGSISTSNTAGGTGTLVPGAATFELQLLENGTVLETQTVAVTLAPNTPSITALNPISGSVFIGGSSTPYTAMLTNPGASLSNVVLQGWIDQGTARRAAGGSMVMCGAGVGVLPNGTFNVSGSIVASNTTGGTGTLVPGAATFELQLIVNGTVLETKTVAVTLATGGYYTLSPAENLQFGLDLI